MPLNSDGYTRKSLDEIVDSMNQTAVDEFGSLIDTSVDSALGHFIGVNAIELSQLWEDVQQLYDSRNPRTVTGAAQDALYLNLNVIRQGETKSTAIITISGSATTSVPQGTEFWPTDDTSRIFTLDSNVEIPASGSIDASVTAQDTGSVAAPAGTLTESNFEGITSTNANDASLGRGPQTDEEFRTSFFNNYGVAGNKTAFAIRSNLSMIDGVTEVMVIENLTDCYIQRDNSDPMPPHSIECVVENGDDTEIINTIVATKAEGIRATGSSSGTYIDQAGTEHLIGYSRPEYISVRLEIDYQLYSEEVFPVDGEDQIAQACYNFGLEEYSIGKDVLPERFYTPIFTVNGIRSAEIKAFYLGSDDEYTSLPIANYQKALLSIDNITITRS
jgi:hypothetical protein